MFCSKGFELKNKKLRKLIKFKYLVNYVKKAFIVLVLFA